MINLDNISIVHKSIVEVIKFFVKQPDEMLGILKLDKNLSPASQTVYATLIKRGNFKSTQDFKVLQAQNFCQKAMTILPRIFDLRAPALATELQNIMMWTRCYIMLNGMPCIKGIEMPTLQYGKVERNKLIKVLRKECAKLDVDQKLGKIEEKYEGGIYGKKKKEFDEKIADPTIKNSQIKGLAAVISDNDKQKQEEMFLSMSNYAALDELEKIVIDKYAFTYKGVVLAPYIVNRDEQPAILNDLRLRKEFVTDVEKVEKYGLKSIIKEKECF